MKKIYFLSGLPRTGTTVLSSIINQNPNIHCTSTSGLLDLLSGVNYVYNEVAQRSLESNEQQIKNIFKGISDSYYNHIKQDIIIDKWRGWVANIPQIKEIISSSPKIICTYRPIEEIIVSFLHLLEQDPSNFIDKVLKSNNQIVNNSNRAKYLWQNGVVGETYNFFVQSLSYKNEILYISYNELVFKTSDTIKKIYEFLDINIYNHSYTNLNTKILDNDTYWDIKNLHLIRNNVEQELKSPQDYLDDDTIKYFKSFNKIFSEIP
jgi:sulfotransferase